MRYSIVFFAALLGSAATTQAGELQDRNVQDIAAPALQERVPFIRPPGWKGTGIPYPKKPLLHVPKVRPGRPKRLRNLEELEERDPCEDSMSTLQERAPVIRPPGWKGIGIPYPKKPLLHVPKGRPTRRIRQRDIEELERRVLQRRALPGSTPRRTGWSGSLINRPYKGPAAPRRRLRDVEELDERDLYDDAWFDSEE